MYFYSDVFSEEKFCVYVLHPLPLQSDYWQTISRENQPPKARPARAFNILENYFFVCLQTTMGYFSKSVYQRLATISKKASSLSNFCGHYY